MAFQNGIDNAGAAVKLPYLVKGGLFQAADRGLIDDSLPNGWRFYADNAAGTGKIHYLVAVDTASNGNQTSLTNPNGVKTWALSIPQLATPAAPTITTAGTAGSTSYSYKIVAVNGFGVSLGTTAASSAGSTSTGNATLTSSNYNVITFSAVSGAAAYIIYRSASSGTPSTTGIIGTVQATVNLASGVQTSTYVFNDTALVGDGTTASTANTTGFINGASAAGVTLTTPANVVVTPVGTVGVTSYSYKLVAVAANGTTTAASSAGSTSTGNATLSASNSNLVTWDFVPGAASFNIYRTVGGATQGKIGNVIATAATSLSFSDTGLAGDSSSAPTSNGTGGQTLGVVSNYIATETGGANAIAGALLDASGNAVPLSPGLVVTIQLAHALQAGANTFALNGGSAVAITSHRNPASTIAAAYVSTGVIQLLYTAAGGWVDLSQ